MNLKSSLAKLLHPPTPEVPQVPEVTAVEQSGFRIELEYPPSSRNEPRYAVNSPNPYIYQVLARHRNTYKDWLGRFSRYNPWLVQIPVHQQDPSHPYYRNLFFPALDSVALYGFIAELKPQIYLEVGSGESTKFARQAIRDQGLQTRMISIDPHPRAEIDQLCDQIIRQPLEDVDLSLLDQLQPNDIVFLDNSHRCFMNSDVTVSFLEVMPRLKSGVYLHLHDICLPYDYPAVWRDRYYSEQYLLGAMLANGVSDYDIILPNGYITYEPELMQVMEAVWSAHSNFQQVEQHGLSFWMRKQ